MCERQIDKALELNAALVKRKRIKASLLCGGLGSPAARAEGPTVAQVLLQAADRRLVHL